MFCILTDKLPTTVSVGGEQYTIDTRTSTALNCIRKLRQDIPEEFKQMYVVKRLGLPSHGIAGAFEFLSGPNKPKGKGKASYDYFQDSSLIYGAFQQSYGLDLDEVTTMHWWRFLALLESIPASTRFMEVIGIRTMEIDPKDSPEVRTKKMRAKAAVALHSDKGGW